MIMKKFKWAVWFVLFLWALKAGYNHYIFFTEGFPFRYTSIADHILKNERSVLFTLNAKKFMEDGIISNEEYSILGELAQFESNHFEIDINTDLNLTQAKQLLADVL
jgi:hypothetical protein